MSKRAFLIFLNIFCVFNAYSQKEERYYLEIGDSTECFRCEEPNPVGSFSKVLLQVAILDYLINNADSNFTLSTKIEMDSIYPSNANLTPAVKDRYRDHTVKDLLIHYHSFDFSIRDELRFFYNKAASGESLNRVKLSKKKRFSYSNINYSVLYKTFTKAAPGYFENFCDRIATSENSIYSLRSINEYLKRDINTNILGPGHIVSNHIFISDLMRYLNSPDNARLKTILLTPIRTAGDKILETVAFSVIRADDNTYYAFEGEIEKHRYLFIGNEDLTQFLSYYTYSKKINARKIIASYWQK